MGPLKRAVGVLIGVVLLGVAGTAWASGDDTPILSNTSVSSITTTSAVLGGGVDPNKEPTTYRFEYGLSPSYGSQTAPGSLAKDDTVHPVSAAIGGLDPATTYHFRLVATNKHGTTRGPDRTFTTLTTGTPGPGPAPPPGDSEPAPEPKLGTSVLVAPSRGQLSVRKPGAAGFVPLELGSELPVGSEVDASNGSLALTAALPSGKTQTGTFGGGRFKLAQDKRGYVDLYLRGRYCAPAKAGVVTAAAKPRSGRRLWGRDHGGRFRTHGRNSHATVRGTRWLVADSCKGTFTRVMSGSVVVRDTVRNKRLVLGAGERYLARPRR
jgi:hypothetical protein